jgi:hypothetical protein
MASRPKVHLSFVCFSLCVMMAAFAASLSAQIQVLPLSIFMNYTERSSKFSVINSLDEPVESWIEIKYGYPVMDDTGKPVVVYDSTAPRNDASGWVKVFPQRFLLEEKGQQTVRFTVSPPPGLADGEYWARIRVSGKLARQLKTKLGQTTQTNVTVVSSMEIPFHFRVGNVMTAISIENPLLQFSKPHRLLLSTEVKKTGNAAYWGTLTLRLIDKKNEVVLRSTKSIVAYQDYTFVTHFDSVNVPRGEYTAQVMVDTKRLDVSASKLVQAKNIEKVFTFIVP